MNYLYLKLRFLTFESICDFYSTNLLTTYFYINRSKYIFFINNAYRYIKEKEGKEYKIQLEH